MGQADARRRRVGLQVNRLLASVLQHHPDQVRAHVMQAAIGRADEVFPGDGALLPASSARGTVIPADSTVAAVCSVATGTLRDDMIVLPASQPRRFPPIHLSRCSAEPQREPRLLCCGAPSQFPLHTPHRLPSWGG